jgi:hypothetical protein
MLRESIGLPRTPRRPASPWTKPRLRLLQRRWVQGARAREIAVELGHGITSNAVIAKIHRLGIARLSPYGGEPAGATPTRRVPLIGRCADIASRIGSAKGRCRPGS